MLTLVLAQSFIMSNLCCCCKKEERDSGFFTAIYDEVNLHARCGCVRGTLAVIAFALIIAGLALTGFDYDKATIYAVTFSGVGLVVVLAFVKVYMENCYRAFSSCSCCRV